MSNDSVPGYFRQLVDKLLGGAPKMKHPAAKAWYRKYQTTLAMSLTLVFAGMIPELLTWVNHVPDRSELETVEVRILATRANEPHFIVELADGRQEEMEWPVPISFFGGFRFAHWNKEEQAALIGCHAVLQGQALRWTLRQRYRVWDLSCSEKRIFIGLDKTAQGYLSWLRSGRNPVGMAAIFLVAAFICLVFLRERRGTL